jgi:hypothetical protein
LTLDYEIKTGGISNNETWKEGNTYLISGNLTVNAGATLVIEPSTICKYTTNVSLIVASGGRLIAKGQKYNYILMTSWKDNSLGESVCSSAGIPAIGDYYAAIYLQQGSSPNSNISYCKIRYSMYALIDDAVNLNNPIKDNVFRDNLISITLSMVSSVYVFNNIITGSVWDGISLSFNNGTLTNSDLVAQNNTIDHCVNGVITQNAYFKEFSNNLLTNCTIALNTNNNFGTHNFNGYYGNSHNFSGTIGGTAEDTYASNPYQQCGNGSFYLSSAYTNNGSTTARVLGLDKKVTQVPMTVTTDISTDTSWDKVPRDTGLVDRGYHYDPVDVVVGSSSKPIINIYSANTSANLRIYPGVVVSFWRSLSQNTSRIWLKNGKFVAHGHADDRIQFRNIFETGDMNTFSLGSSDLYGYYFGIEFGSGVEPESYAQFCEFHHACSGILLDPSIAKPMYRRFSDNIFNGCYYGITAIDAYLRAENNLFLCNSNSSTQIYLLSSCNTTILRNNSFIGNLSGSLGIYSETNGNIDIRNNIFTGFKGTAIKLPSNSLTGKISKNCYFNNSINNTVNSINIEDPIYKTPQFAWNTASSSYWNGYYLAQTTGDASRTPLKGSYLDLTNGITVNLTSAPYYWSITAYTNPESGGSYPLGCYLGHSGYSDSSWEWAEYVSDPTGYISISILNGASQWSINDGDYITLNFQNGTNLKVYLPTATFPECGDPWDDSNDYLNLWVAEDGSVYYAYSGHTVTSTGVINQDAPYAMNYDTGGLAKASFSNMGNSTCVNSGDTTVRAYGSTASSYSKDSGKVDIGYHAKNPGYIMVGENGRQFEYEDGTPFVASGGAVLWASVEYQNNDTRPVLDKYLKALRDKGVTALTMSFHQNRCLPWGYENDAQTAWAVSTAKGVFSDETAQWLDHYIDSLEKADLKLGLLVWQGSDGYGTVSLVTGYSYNTTISVTTTEYTISTTTTIQQLPHYQDFPSPRHHYNPFWSGSTIFHGGAADSPLDIFTKPECFDYQTTTMKYYVDRWGDRESLIYWDPLLETDYYYLTPAQLMGWTENVHKFIKDYELKKYGHRHLVTASAGRPLACFYFPQRSVGIGRIHDHIVYMPSMTNSFTGYSLNKQLDYSSESNATTINATYFNDPNLDFTCAHFGGDSTLSFPAIDTITHNSLWYPVLGEQWLRDSVGSVLASTTQFWLEKAFAVTTAGKRPYFAGLYYPPYFTPWVAESTFRKDDASLVDVGTTLYAISTLLIDRHIAPEFHDAYNYYLNWALTAGGAAGPGFTGSEQVYNMFTPGSNSSYVNNGYHTDYNLDTVYYNDTTMFNLFNKNRREYNTFTMQMLYDKLALYKVMTCVNWNSRTWDNLGGSNRISISGFTNVSPIYSGNSSNMIAYFCRDMRDTTVNYSTSTVTNMVVTFNGFPEFTPIYLTWFNPKTGEVISRTSFSEGVTQVTAPPFTRDIVAVLKPE